MPFNPGRYAKLGRAIHRTSVGKAIAKGLDYVADRVALKFSKQGKAVAKEIANDAPFVRKEVLKSPGLVRSKEVSFRSDLPGRAGEIAYAAGRDSAQRMLKKGIKPRPQTGGAGTKFQQGFNVEAGIMSSGSRSALDKVSERAGRLPGMGYAGMISRHGRQTRIYRAHENFSRLGKTAVGAAGAGFAAGSAYLASKKRK